MPTTKTTASTASSASSSVFASPQCDGRDDAESDEAEDVVEDGRAEDDGDRASAMEAEVAEHAHGDADGGRHERDGDEEALAQRVLEDEAAGQAADERQHGAEDRDLDGRGSGLGELLHVGVEAGGEEQEDHAQLAQRLQELGAVDEVQREGAEERAREQLADHGRLLDALEQPAQQARPGEGEEDLEEDAGGVFHRPEVYSHAFRGCGGTCG